MNISLKNLLIVAAGLSAAGSISLQAGSLTFQSDGTTLGAQDENIPDVLVGNIAGLTFSPVIQNALGTFTTIPPGAPAGTEVINLPGYDATTGTGADGFFEVMFTLPAGFSGASLSGAGNVDDQGFVFLNGHNLGANLYEFANNSFSTSDSSFFDAGANTLIIADWNSGGGPSGAAFYGTVSYSSGVPDTGGILLTTCFGLVCAAMGIYHRRTSHA
jgi:hypothetical protein